MSHVDVIRAWKDAGYRQSLTESQRAALPSNPAGTIELSAAELDGVVGGAGRPPIPQSRRYSCTPRLCC
jgi:mersacidin/lichenicidin family type 2 lantibiotic